MVWWSFEPVWLILLWGNLLDILLHPMFVPIVGYMWNEKILSDATLRFGLEGHLDGNEGKTIFSFDINIIQK